MSDIPVINTRRIRRIKGGFSFVPHRFLNDGFFASLSHHELLAYFFWVLAADRFGMSFYGDRSIGQLTGLDQSELEHARELLISKDLIAHRQPFIQVLELPKCPPPVPGDSVPNPASKILESLLEENHDR